MSAIGSSVNLTSLEDILRVLPPDAKNVIAKCLQYNKSGCRVSGSLKAVRLSCRSLREVVDCGVRSIELTLRASDRDLLQAGQRPPFRHWPRVSDIYVQYDISDQDLRDHPSLAGNITALVLTSIPLEARQRITSLKLDLSPLSHSFPTALASVFHSLPALQSVVLGGNLTDDPLEQLVILQSLAALPHLRQLTMDNGRAVDHMHLLKNSLRRLELDVGSILFDSSMASCVVQLSKLERLSIAYVNDLDVLCQLVRGLPPTVQVLKLPWCGALHGFDYGEPENMEIEFEGGHVTSIEGDCASYGGLAKLLSCRRASQAGCAIGDQRLESVRVYDLYVSGDDMHAGPEAALLQAQLQRCGYVWAGMVHIESTVAPAWAMQVLRSLRRVRDLSLQMCVPGGGQGGHWLWIRNSNPSQRQSAAAATSSAQGEGPRRSLVDLALFHMTAAAPTADDAKEAEREAAQALAADGPSCALLLRGPLLSGVVADAAALEAWMRRLAEGLAEAPAEAPAEELRWPARRRRDVLSYLSLPLPPPRNAAEGAVVVKCASAAGAAAVAEAAMAAAAVVGPIGGVAAPIAVCRLRDVRKHEGPSSIFGRALDKAAQQTWDSKGPGGDRLQWLMEEWASVRVWPEEVRI